MDMKPLTDIQPWPDLVPDLDPLTDTEYAALKESIEEHGMQTPILIDEADRIIDGHHRFKIAQELGHERLACEYILKRDDAEKYQIAISLNADRRQMTEEKIAELREARRQKVAEMRAAGKSIRAIADQVGVGKTTVERDLEKEGVPGGTPDTVIGKDGKEYPATQATDDEPTAADWLARYRALVDETEGKAVLLEAGPSADRCYLAFDETATQIAQACDHPADYIYISPEEKAVPVAQISKRNAAAMRAVDDLFSGKFVFLEAGSLDEIVKQTFDLPGPDGELYTAWPSTIEPGTASLPLPKDEGANGIKSQLQPLMTSDSPEWYTPQEILDLVIALMGGIDLDPCSNSHEGPNVPAETHFTKEDDGLNQDWHGRVYMNPPYGRVIDKWAEKLIDEFESGRVTQAIALVPARTDTAWFRRFAKYPFCMIDGRLKFSEHENSAPFPSAIFALGIPVDRFETVFDGVGRVVAPPNPNERYFRKVMEDCQDLLIVFFDEHPELGDNPQLDLLWDILTEAQTEMGYAVTERDVA